MPPSRSDRNVQFSGAVIPAFLQKLHAQVNGGRSTGGSGSGSGSGSREGGGGGGGGGEDEWDSMFGPSSSSSLPSTSRGVAEDEGDEEDEWSGAQVVVLKEGRHLTEEQVQREKEDRVGMTLRNDGKVDAATTSSSSEKAKSSAMGISTPSHSQRKRPRREAITNTETDEPPLLLSVSSSTDLQAGKKQRTGGANKGEDPLASVRRLIHADRKGERGGKRDQESKGGEGEGASTSTSTSTSTSPSTSSLKSKQNTKDEEKKEKKRALQEEKKKRGKGLSFGYED